MNPISWIISAVLDPVLKTALAIFNKKEDTNLEKYKVDGTVNTSLIAAEVEIIKVKGELLKNQILVYLQVGFGIPLMIYYGKCILWDKVLGLGYTDALTGEIATYSQWIVAFLFVHSGIMALARK